MYRVFYHCIRATDEVPAETPVPMDIADVHSGLFPLLKEDGEYLGIVDEAGTTLQMMYQAEEDLYWTEVPSPEDRGSFGKALTFDEASNLIKSLDGPIRRSGYAGFSFTSW